LKIKYIIIALTIVAIIVFTTLVVIKTTKKDKPINGLTYMHFTYTTGYHMYAYTIYDIEYKDGKYIASIKPTDIPDEEKKEVELSNEVVTNIEKKLTEYNVSRWDGFNENDKYVLDGDSFSFNLKYDNDKNISAHGYMRWPENYREVKNYLDEVLGSLY